MTKLATEKVNKKDLSEASFNRLIDLIYKTLEFDNSWAEFFEVVCESIGAKYVHMYALDKLHSTISWSNGNDLPAEGELDLIHKYQFIDPRAPFVFSIQPLEWFHDHEHFDENFMLENQFYQEFLIPWGLKYVSLSKVIDNQQANIVFAALSSPEQGPLPQDSVEFLTKLLPHISRVCRLSLQNFIYSTQALVGHTLINKLRQPVILVSTAGEVVHTNDSAKKLLNLTNLLSLKNGQLALPTKFNQVFFDDCLAMEYELRENKSNQTATEFKLLKISSSGHDETLYAFYSLLLPQRMMGVFGLRPLIMLFFYHPQSAPKIDSAILSAAFGLTPAECRTAILLAEGLSQKAIAKQLSVKHDTVRKQLQTIYQKTSTNQQSELIRLMLHLPSNFVQESDIAEVKTLALKK